jgi:FMN phosphatase YigB (HAD superfamily)
MEIRSISDFYRFSLFIFDLDNTIYKEEDYLFLAYMAIAGKFAGILPSTKKEQLFKMMKDLHQKQGPDKLFNKFLMAVDLDNSYLPECIEILRSFVPENPIEIDKKINNILSCLKGMSKKIFVLTNGNVDQQRNKIHHINWEGMEKYISFVFANEIEPKPSPAGVNYILKVSGIEKEKAIFIGDSETDRICALNSGVQFLNIHFLADLR